MRTIRDDAGEMCAETFAWWLKQTDLLDQISEEQCAAMAYAFSAGWILAQTRGPHRESTATIPEAAGGAMTEHTEDCCMNGVPRTAGPHPDCPGIDELNRIRRETAAAVRTATCEDRHVSD